MKRQFLFGTMLSAALAVGVAAQQTQGGQTAGTSGADQAGRQGQTVTVTGCLERGGQMAGATGTQPGAATGTAGTTAQAGQQAAGFILTQVSPSGAAGAAGTQPGQTGTQAGQPGQTKTQPGQTGQTAQPGQAGTQPGTAAGTTGARPGSYRLTGGEDQNLQKYVGQRVEITGTMTPASGATGAGTTPGQTGTQPGQPGQTGTQAGQPGQKGTQAGQPGQAGTGSTMAQGGAQGAMPTLRVTSVKPVAGSCQ